MNEQIGRQTVISIRLLVTLILIIGISIGIGTAFLIRLALKDQETPLQTPIIEEISKKIEETRIDEKKEEVKIVEKNILADKYRNSGDWGEYVKFDDVYILLGRNETSDNNHYCLEVLQFQFENRIDFELCYEDEKTRENKFLYFTTLLRKFNE